MTLVCTQHPAVIVLFALCGLFVVLAGRILKFSPMTALTAGICGAATVIVALVCGVPMVEILGILLLLTGLGFLSIGKEGNA